MSRENLFGGTVLNRFTCWSLNVLHVYDSLQCDCDNLDFFFSLRKANCEEIISIDIKKYERQFKVILKS